MLNDEDGEDEDKDHEGSQEETIFIPLGFVHERPRTFYISTDPEWESFWKLRKDSKRMKSVQRKHLL